MSMPQLSTYENTSSNTNKQTKIDHKINKIKAKKLGTYIIV